MRSTCTSRFLVALLCQRHPRTASLRNLEDFLRDVADVRDFSLSGEEVERERHHIDILNGNAWYLVHGI